MGRLWPIASFRCAAEFGRYRGIADFSKPTDRQIYDYKSRPMADMGLSTANEATVRVVKLSRMLDHDMYRRIRLNFFRLHCQFVSGNDRRTS